MINNGSSKRQIEFLPIQTHVKGFEIGHARDRDPLCQSWSS